MKLVVALEMGHDGTQVRNEGDQFYVDDARLTDGSTWFRAVDPDDGKDADNVDPFLDRAIPDIVADLPALTVEELSKYRADEVAGKSRKGLLAEFDAEAAKR